MEGPPVFEGYPLSNGRPCEGGPLCGVVVSLDGGDVDPPASAENEVFAELQVGFRGAQVADGGLHGGSFGGVGVHDSPREVDVVSRPAATPRPAERAGT